MLFGLRWWQTLLGLLAVWQLFDLSFALAGWLGMIILLGLMGLATVVRNRAPWLTHAIETILGFALLAQVSAILAAFINPSQIVAHWIAALLVALAGVFGSGLLYRWLRSRRAAMRRAHLKQPRGDTL